MSDSPSPASEELLPSSPSNAESARAAGEAAGDKIDRYQLIEPLGEGGMGTVWVAQQSEPVRRQVALKIIKLGMDTREVVVRFEAERQALALMDHPHIAKVLDGGATASGRPYFVMERVEGTRITEYCDSHELSLDERLELFTKVCDAIQHAHQKGIIHRDIKPSNVLVSMVDGLAAPMVIDFGVAKATSAELTQKTLLTGAAQVIGTPEYMAPEQAGMSGSDVDTRADVYSLGVLLYELLTGTKPFDLRQVLESGYDEFLRTIREYEPDKPSTRVSALGESATSIAARRRSTAEGLRKHLRGDLDWIVMKAVEKDRDRRYETANEFAADIERYRSQEPVLAAPPSARYRFGKFVRRRRKMVAALSAIAVLLVAGSIGTGIGLWRAMRANEALDEALDEKSLALKEEERQRGLAQANEARARQAERDAQAETKRAQLAEEETRQRARELEQVTDFQSDQLASIDVALMGERLRTALMAEIPEEQAGALAAALAEVNFTDLAVNSLEENILARSIEGIDSQFVDQPVVRARLLYTIGVTLRQMSRHQSAFDVMTRSLALRRSVLGDEHPDTLDSISHLAYLLEKLGRIPEAETYYREALDGFRRVSGKRSRDVMIVLGNWSILTWGQFRFAEAEDQLREAMAIAQEVLAEDDVSHVSLNLNMGEMLRDQGRLAEAEPFLARALEFSRRVLGDRDRETLKAIHFMGVLLEDLNRSAEAETYFREARDGRRQVMGTSHVNTLASTSMLGMALNSQGKLEEAEPVLREAAEGTRASLGPEHPHTLTTLGNLAGLLKDQGKLAEAETINREVLAARTRVLGENHLETAMTSNNLALLILDQGRLDEAEPLLWAAFTVFCEIVGAEHRYTRAVHGLLNNLLTERLGAARAAGDDERTGLVLARLGKVSLLIGNPEAAEPLLGEALEFLFSALPEGDPRLWQSMSDLGAALAAQLRYSDAEPLLLESAEELLAMPAPSAPAQLEETKPATVIERVAELYEAWHTAAPADGHGVNASEWRQKLADWKRARDLAGDE